MQGSKAAKWKQQSSQLRAAMQAARPGQVTWWCVYWAHESAACLLFNNGAGVCSPCCVGVSCNSGPQVQLPEVEAGSDLLEVPACSNAQLARLCL